MKTGYLFLLLTFFLCVMSCQSMRAIVRIENLTAERLEVDLGQASKSFFIEPEEVKRIKLQGMFPDKFLIKKNGKCLDYQRPLPSRIFTRPNLLIAKDEKIYSGGVKRMNKSPQPYGFPINPER